MISFSDDQLEKFKHLRKVIFSRDGPYVAVTVLNTEKGTEHSVWILYVIQFTFHFFSCPLAKLFDRMSTKLGGVA